MSARAVGKQSRVAILTLWGALACTATTATPAARQTDTPKRPAAQAAVNPLPARALSALIPAAGLEWLLLLRPRRLAANAELRGASTELVPDEAWDRYARNTGVQPLQLDAIAIGHFELATVYLLEGSTELAQSAERSFRQRSTISVQARQPHPAITVLHGMLEGSPETFVRLGPTRVGIVVGSPLLADAVVAFAWRSLRSPSALDGTALNGLGARLGDAPLQFYVPGPLQRDAGAADSALLERAGALAACLQVDAANLHATLILRGDFAADDVGAATALWQQIAASPTGRLLNLERAFTAPRVALEASALTFAAAVDAAALAAGLHAAVGAEMDELMLPREATSAVRSPSLRDH